MQNSSGKIKENKIDRVTFESETDNRSCHWRQNARFDKKENWSSPLLSSLSFHYTVFLYVEHSSKQQKRIEKEELSINNDINLVGEENFILFSKKWHMWIRQDGTYVRACVHICACVNDNQVSGNGSSGATCKHNTTHCHKERT